MRPADSRQTPSDTHTNTQSWRARNQRTPCAGEAGREGSALSKEAGNHGGLPPPQGRHASASAWAAAYSRPTSVGLSVGNKRGCWKSKWGAHTASKRACQRKRRAAVGEHYFSNRVPASSLFHPPHLDAISLPFPSLPRPTVLSPSFSFLLLPLPFGLLRALANNSSGGT